MQTALLMIDVQESFTQRPYWSQSGADAFLVLLGRPGLRETLPAAAMAGCGTDRQFRRARARRLGAG